MEPSCCCGCLAATACRVDLVDKLFDGSASLLFASLVHGKALSREEIDQLKKLVDDLK